MNIYFSPSRCGFYLPEIHGDAMPGDVVAIPPEEYEALLAGQEQGRQIAAGEDGRPVLVDLPPPPPRTPASIALWQFRRELRARGWWAAVQAAIAQLPDGEREDVEEWLEYGVEVQRNAPLLLQLAEALGLTDQLDDAFRTAAARTL